MWHYATHAGAQLGSSPHSSCQGFGGGLTAPTGTSSMSFSQPWQGRRAGVCKRRTVAGHGKYGEVGVQLLGLLLLLLLLARRRLLHDLHLVVLPAGSLPVRQLARTAPLPLGRPPLPLLRPLLLLIRAAQVDDLPHGR